MIYNLSSGNKGWPSLFVFTLIVILANVQPINAIVPALTYMFHNETNPSVGSGYHMSQPRISFAGAASTFHLFDFTDLNCNSIMNYLCVLIY